jgi:hypothetical protein
MICSIFPNRADFARKLTLRPLLKNNERHDSKLTKFIYNEEGLQYLFWCENYLCFSYVAWSGSERLLLIPSFELLRTVFSLVDKLVEITIHISLTGTSGSVEQQSYQSSWRHTLSSNC